MSKDQEESKQFQLAPQRFVDQVSNVFTSEMGTKLQFSDYQKTLAQHLFLKVDAALKEYEEKRVARHQDKAPYTWSNINMHQLALDAVHTINLGLDALLPNHVSAIPYYNSTLGKYNLDLRPGYEGEDFYRRETALEKPIDIRYELVHETDVFIPLKKSHSREIETYEFEIKQPFKRGEVIGGFGYIIYEDPKKNKLVILDDDDFEKSHKYAKTDEFWGKHPEKMKFKTLVHRTTEKIKPDPKKVNMKSYAYMENKGSKDEVRHEIEGNANSEIFDISDDDIKPADDSPQPASEPPMDEPDPNPAETEQPESEPTGEPESAPKEGPEF